MKIDFTLLTITVCRVLGWAIAAAAMMALLVKASSAQDSAMDRALIEHLNPVAVLQKKIDSLEAKIDKLTSAIADHKTNVDDSIEQLKSSIETASFKPVVETKPPIPETKDAKTAEKPKAQSYTVVGHSHKCPNCGTVWAHAPGRTAVSHNCPNCGASQYVVHQEGVRITVNSTQAAPRATAQPQASGCANGQCNLPRRVLRWMNR
jgi:rubrerythrin